MILHFRTYSKTNHDIEEVLRCGHLRGCQVNDPIIVFGDSIRDSVVKLNNIYNEIFKFIKRDINLRSGSFTVEVDDMIGPVIKEKYGFKQVKPTKQNFEQQYFGNWDTNAEFIRTCGECENFGPDGCKTSSIEAKYGSGSTPACSEFVGTKI